MTTTRASDVYYDPYDVAINADPYPVFGAGRFDFVADLGAQMPMRVIGMLLGIPEQDQETIRDHVDASLRTQAGEPMRSPGSDALSGEIFADYIDWRAEHPSDDL